MGLPHRADVGGIQFDGRRLLNQADRHDQTGACPFADKYPAHACERSPHHLHFHPFFEVRVGIKGKCARHQLADRFNLVIGDRNRDPIDSQDLDYTHSGDD